MQCFLGRSHKLVLWDPFKAVTSRQKGVLTLTNAIGSRNPVQKNMLCKCCCSPCLSFPRPGKTFCHTLADTALAAALPKILIQSRCLVYAFQRTTWHFLFVFTEKREQANTLSAVLAFSKKRQLCTVAVICMVAHTVFCVVTCSNCS